MQMIQASDRATEPVRPASMAFPEDGLGCVGTIARRESCGAEGLHSPKPASNALIRALAVVESRLVPLFRAEGGRCTTRQV